MTDTVAFVTVSYGPDRDRCALMRRSVEALAPAISHLIVVDRADLPMFRRFQDKQTTVVATEDLLPLWFRRLDLRRLHLRSNVWVQAVGRPVRGWVLQQLIKLAVAEQLDQDVIVHVDSDVVLTRPFDRASVVDQDGRVRLFAMPDAVDANLPGHVAWHRSAERLLGIPAAPLPAPDFITSLVPWKRANAVELLERIEATTGRHWLRAVAAATHVSEYILYGRFVTDVQGDASGQYATSSSLCHDYWTHAPLTECELETFLDRAGPDHIGVSITAKAGMDPGEYAAVVERRWTNRGAAAAGAQATSQIPGRCE